MKKLILIDGTGLIFRGFYSIPPYFRSPNGVQTNAVFGFTSMLLSLMNEHKPDYLAVAFDRKGPTKRHEEYAEYKATRVAAPDELYAQIPLVKDVVNTFNLPLFEQDGVEADDLLATIVHKTADVKNLTVEVATGDFDLFQLISPRVSVLYPEKGFKEAKRYDPEAVYTKYSLRPDQIPDFKGLAGDSSDNIPGVRGIGGKGAVNLLAKYDSLEGIYEHLDELSDSVRTKLTEGKESAYKCRDLTRLMVDIPLDFDLHSCTVRDFDSGSARKLFGSLGFRALVRRLDDLFGAPVEQESLF